LKLRFTRRRSRNINPSGYVAAPDTKATQKGTKYAPIVRNHVTASFRYRPIAAVSSKPPYQMGVRSFREFS